MSPVHRHKGEGAIHEHRPDYSEVWQVRPAEVGIVEQKNVARGDVISEVIQNGTPGYRQRANVHRDALTLSNKPALTIQDCRREVPARVQDLGERCAEHHVHHLYGDRLQPVPNYGQSDRVSPNLVASL